MKITPDCILCNLNTALMAIREVTDDRKAVRELTTRVLELPGLRGLDWSITGSDLAEQMFATITAASGNPDPFKEWKEQENKKCLDVYPLIQDFIHKSEDPLLTAVNLAIMGNSIDPMGVENLDDVEEAMRRSVEKQVPEDGLRQLKKGLEQSSQLVYLGDNCGEIVYDKLLIETIKGYYDTEVVFVARSKPALNDATLKEAHHVGMHTIATVMENGIDGPLPGTVLSRCSQDLRDLWSSADLIISKGGGNFDSLDEEENITKPLYYLLMSKCIPYRDYFGIPLHYPILARASTKQ